MNKLNRYTKKDKIYSILGKIIVISFVFMLLFSQEANMLSFQERYFNINSGLFEENVNKVSSKQAPLGKLKLLWMEYGQEVKNPLATCVIGSTVYIIGIGNEYNEYSIEARDTNTGKFLYSYSWKDGPLIDCTVLDNYLYVVGGNGVWHILKFTPDLKLVKKLNYNFNVTSNVDVNTIATDGKFLYVGGDTGDNEQWHVIKVEPSNLSVIKNYTSDRAGYGATVHFINVNPFDGRIWLVGMANGIGRIQILDDDLLLLTSKDLSFDIISSKIAFDESGYAYIIGMYDDKRKKILLKVSPNLQIVEVNYLDADIILYSYGYLYLATSKYIDGYHRHVLMKATKDLNVIDELILSDQINADCFFHGKKMAIAANKLFVTGNCEIYKPEQWIHKIWSVIYSVSIEEVKVSMFAPNKKIYKQGDKAEFTFTLINLEEKSYTYWVRLAIINPKSEVILTDVMSLSLAGGETKSFTLFWEVSSGALAGTYFPILYIYDNDPRIYETAYFVVYPSMYPFMVENPDISYIEVIGSGNNKLVHIHIQRYALEYEITYRDYITYMQIVKLLTGDIPQIIPLLKKLPVELERIINLASSKPYDITIVLIYDRLGYALETNPAEILDETVYSIVNSILWKTAKMILDLSLPDIPLPPLDKLILVPKELSEIQAPYYSLLLIPIKLNVEWLTPIATSYQKGRTVEIRVKAINPQTNEPVTGASLVLNVRYGTGTQTVNSYPLFELGNGIYYYLYWISPDAPGGFYDLNIHAVKNPTGNEPGFFGLSTARSFMVEPSVSPVDITELDLEASPIVIGLDEYTVVTVKYSVLATEPFSYHVRVELWQDVKLFLDKKLGETEGYIEEYSYTFKIKGSDLGWINHVGKHELYAKVIISWIPPGTTLLQSIKRESYRITVTVTGEEWSSGTAIILQETEDKLYLHVYDSRGRHVGIDYTANRSIVEIPGSIYESFLNGEVIILPEDVKDFYIVVDATYSHLALESYNITVLIIKEKKIVNHVSIVKEINQGQKHEFRANISPSEELQITTLTQTSPTQPSSPTTPPSSPPTLSVTSLIQTPTTIPFSLELIIIIIVIAATLASLVIVLRKYKAK
jgi:hypothetical protein